MLPYCLKHWRVGTKGIIDYGPSIGVGLIVVSLLLSARLYVLFLGSGSQAGQNRNYDKIPQNSS